MKTEVTERPGASPVMSDGSVSEASAIYADKGGKGLSMASAADGESSLLQAVRALSPELSEAAATTERERGISKELMAKLRAAGLFRMMVPKSYGGEELDLLQAVRVIEALAKADGSAGWNAMVIFGFNVAIGSYSKPVLDRILEDDGDVLIRGALAPLGQAIPTDGGYVISGQWPFASGSFEPRWILASSLVMGETGPVMSAAGTPEIRMALLPADQAELLDTWYTVGMSGSASHDFTVRGAQVAEDYTTNFFDPTITSSYETPLLKLPFPALTGPTHSAVVIGIAQGALDDLAAHAQTKRMTFNPAMRIADDPVFRHRLGQLAVRLGTLRAAMDQQVARTMRHVNEGTPILPQEFAEGGALVSYTHVECLDIVNEAFSLAGSSPVYSKFPLQRRWRDVRVAAQHVGASVSSYQTLGGMLVGDAVPLGLLG